MEIKELYDKLSRQVSSLEKRQRELLQASLKPSDMTVAPRLYIRGMFVEFDVESDNLIVKANGQTYYYPIDCYDSAWLPFPGHQVLVFLTEEGIRMTGFGANGRRLPIARREDMVLTSFHLNAGSWSFKHASGLHLTLPIPERLPAETPLKLGAHYQFRIVDSYPDRFYILDSMNQHTTYRKDIINTVMHSQLNAESKS